MNSITCPYCGNSLKATERGCHRCGLNLDFYKKVDRVVLRTLPMFLIGLIALVIILIVFIKRA